MIQRRTLLATALAASGAITLASCTNSPTTPTISGTPASPNNPENPVPLAPRPQVSRFSGSLFTKLIVEGENLVFSPTSVLLALGLLRSGASGATAAQLDRVIASTGLDDWQTWASQTLAMLKSLNLTSADGTDPSIKLKVELNLANAAFVRDGTTITPTYRQRLAETHRAEIAAVDFTNTGQAAKAVNEWIAGHTANKITDLVSADAITPQTVLMLANALHLAADWAERFDREATTTAPFHRADDSVVEVPMMHRRAYNWYADDNVVATRLHFAGRKLAMALVLPSSVPAATAHTWSLGGLDRILAGLDEEQQVTLSVPRWKFEWKAQLNNALRALDLDAMFEPSTDLSEGLGQGDWQVDEVAHGATIEVDESGVVASAATAIGVAQAAGPADRQLTLVFDRPFFFVIYEVDSHLPLFIGQVADPTS